MDSEIKVQIDYAADDSCQIQLWAKGTHAEDKFLAACEKTLFSWDKRQLSLAGKPVVHAHWRTVAADAETRSCGVCDYVRKPSQPGRGAYPVTVLDEWLPLQVFTDGHTSQLQQTESWNFYDNRQNPLGC